MKTVFIYLTAFIINSIGTICMGLFFTASGFKWYHLFLLIGSQLIYIPAFNHWINYFKNLYK